MEILVHGDLHPGRHAGAFERVVAALRAGDFRAANVKKLTPTPYYRAELSAADRLVFRLGDYAGARCILLLEIIENHAYDRARFLNGAVVDETRLQPLHAPPDDAAAEALALAYVHPGRRYFHLLDKVLSFDDDQHEALHLPPPLILIGSAGSGKTAVVLEKLKRLTGEVAYITLSPFLAEHASRLYFSHGYENDRQDVDFLSFKEYLESVRVPAGRPVSFRAFAGWFARHRTASPVKDAHRLFEEFSGVLTGAAVDRPWLEREDYLSLGVRRSIFNADEREAVYALFEKYRSWLAEDGLYDLNIESHRAQAHVEKRYDAVMLDEVQDLTNMQVHLVLAALRQPGNFVLCGDANQVVHPNFFSWSALKSMFYEQRMQGRAEIVRILNANYRNAPCITDLANRILRVKNARFGSVDRESTYLARSTAGVEGEAHLLDAGPAVVRDLDDKTCRSARVAVIVLREEDKAGARRSFRTPLVFSIQEAKGLEYETIVLFNMVSSSNRDFAEIAEGVSAADLEAELQYARARDKTDKSLDVYKFFINAFFVAVTRAVRTLYVVEQHGVHPFLALLDLRPATTGVKVRSQSSTAEEWKTEARRLEMQGKEEQAEAIRRTILSQQPVPWKVLTPSNLADLDREAFDPERFNKQAKQLLFEYAATYCDLPRLCRLEEMKFSRAARFVAELPNIERKYQADYAERSLTVLRQKLEKYGVDFRNPLNQTPLMIAACRGMPDLVEDLMRQGSNPHLRDNFGRTAFHVALRQAFMVAGYARDSLGRIYDLLAPAAVNVKTDGQLHKIDRHRMEFFVFEVMVALLQDLLRRKIEYAVPGLQTGDIVHHLGQFPNRVLPLHRRHRGAITAALAGNEMFSPAPRNRRLFLRLRRGYYVPNPDLEIEVGGEWVNIYTFIGLGQMIDDRNPHLQYFADVLDRVRQQYREWKVGLSAPRPASSRPDAGAPPADNRAIYEQGFFL